MIDGLTLEYAYARVGARLSQRPDERLWLQLHSARSVAALLDAVRASPAAPAVSGVQLTGDGDIIEAAFRQQLRTRIAEVVAWSPLEWRPALSHTRHLVDMPAVVQLLTDEPPPRWMVADPVLAEYALPNRAQRRAALTAGPLAGIAAAAEATDADRAPPRSAAARAAARSGVPALHRALGAWEREWHALWPHGADGCTLHTLARLLRSHVSAFGGLHADDAATARQTLGARLLGLLHRAAAQPAALFAYLALYALDLERLRAEFVLRARMAMTVPS